MPLDVGIVGLPGAGKTTLFTALTGVSATPYGQEHVGIAPIPDDRLEPIAEVESSAKTTPATIRVVDPPGLSAPVLGELRKADALLAVLRAFGPDADPAHDLESIELELVVADRDHVEKRLERVRSQAKSGDPRLREQAAELERLLAHVEAGDPLRSYERVLPPELEPLTTKPMIQVVNGGDGGFDLKLEAELADLSPEEAAEFRDGPSGFENVRPAHVLHRRREGDASVDTPPGQHRARRGRDDPFRHRARLHPLRGDRVARPRRGGESRRGRPPRPTAAGGEGLRRRRRRHPQHPLQRLAAAAVAIAIAIAVAVLAVGCHPGLLSSTAVDVTGTCYIDDCQ
jgi:hypothetical protein